MFSILIFSLFFFFFLLSLRPHRRIVVDIGKGIYYWTDSQNEIDLSRWEQRIFCQNGEDGVIAKIFELVGVHSKYYVEFGAIDGMTISNTLVLRERQGWKGLLLDASHENFQINLHKAFITAENINALFEKHNVPYDLDLLSIDIDFNDFYIWKALDDKYRPRLIIIEYNGTHLPSEDKIVPYDPNGCWDNSNYYGASIKALFNLGKKKGYSLIYAEKQGVNLFFLRDDLVEKCAYRFKDINNVKKTYRMPKYGQGPNGGHEQDPYDRPYVSSESILEGICEFGTTTMKKENFVEQINK
jgi:hypothetical protein